ncbi:MAG: hypothetical protein PHP59_02565 [Methanofollis sp.]|uniref:hypothetical protein n=1 Tax=Methanofollis sp. TaxID=2052835 RepID=UPI00262F1256|nr:hypothetical protein [Methanofollis sp.]MDD4254241.1 hypothetical protein [Methanofollis sp.]
MLLGVIITLLCIPAAVTAAGGDSYYITVGTGDAKDYKGICIKTVDALDPLDVGNTLVTLKSTETGDLKAIEYPLLGTITREFNPASGTYHGTDVTVTGTKTVNGKTLPCHYQVYTTRTIPSFTVKVPGRCGNVLLIKCPENIDKDANFTNLFNAAEKEGYLFTNYGVYYNIGNGIGYYGDQSKRYDNEKDLNYTLNKNLVNLNSFNFNAGNDLLDAVPKPKAGEYLLTAVEYDSSCNTMHVLAAMPILILDGKTAITWNGDNPYYQNQNKDITVSFSGDVDKVAYALVKKDTRYGLTVEVDTAELAKQPVPTSAANAISILKNIAGDGISAEYTLICDADARDVNYNKDSCLAIVEGYGCSGANDASSVTITKETLKGLKTGTYYLYALGMKDEKVVAIDQTNVCISAVAPTPTPRPSGGGGGGGNGGSPISPEPPVSYEGKGNLMTNSNGITTRSVEISATDKVATLFVPSGVKALDANGKPLAEVSLKPLAGDKMPAAPSGAMFRFAGYAYEASPEGATFNPGITLTLEIPEEIWNTLDLTDRQLTMMWYNKETGLWEEIQTTISRGTRTVTATVTHFSTYALFTEPVTTPTPPDTQTPATPTTSLVEEPPAEGLPMTMILFAIIALVIIAAVGYFFIMKK